MSDARWNDEETIWTGSVGEAVRRLDRACVMVAPPPAGIMGYRAILGAFDSAPRWQHVAMSDRREVATDELTILAYHVTARRAGAEDYHALVSSTWLQRGEDWKLVQHQQTPL